MDFPLHAETAGYMKEDGMGWVEKSCFSRRKAIEEGWGEPGELLSDELTIVYKIVSCCLSRVSDVGKFGSPSDRCIDSSTKGKGKKEAINPRHPRETEYPPSIRSKDLTFCRPSRSSPINSTQPFPTPPAHLIT